jgi:tRNA(Ile)-lysidine synthase TilS/MesJ
MGDGRGLTRDAADKPHVAALRLGTCARCRTVEHRIVRTQRLKLAAGALVVGGHNGDR